MKYLPRPVYALLKRAIPIACVDVLPFRRSAGIVEVGLILRQGERRGRVGWALVGGRVQYEETLRHALERHLSDTLGPTAAWSVPDMEAPLHAAEYFPAPSVGQRHDPRQHAVALGYVAYIAGEVDPRGEALDFRWFTVDALPPEDQIVFGQVSVVRVLVDHLPT